ncbi:hypothetical protein [Roseibium sp. MMSF_3544]|uniref:hypothetical protein n=1 Tax=unclassified Roseibium TaxID=2629323 RepID=UPI00273D35DB|nr:hypothetical protein [Roseibium sp. MMSF_3544]
MSEPVTVLAPIKLAHGKTETDLLEASRRFQEKFVSHQDGILRRELVRTSEGEYLDIVQFKSRDDAEKVVEAERTSPDCAEFFSVMDLSDVDMDAELPMYRSLATYI